MPFKIEATYESGVLKPDGPLPLKENERVTIEIRPQTSLARRRAGSIKWTGDPEVLRKLAEDPEFGVLEAQ